jgi:protein-disulfide isomerase
MGSLSGRVEKIEALIPSRGKPEKLTVNLDGAPMLGERNAKVGMVEFSDYQCPYCRHFHLETFPQLQKTYIDSGKLVFAVKNFPLDFHPRAMDAAVAVSCARQQNIKAFWDVQGELFSHQNRLGKDLYNELVKRYGLDRKKFSKCMTDDKQKVAITRDLKYAQSLGVQGTPTFFIGRLEGDRLVDAVRVVGAQPARVFTRVLDSFIKADSTKSAE